MFTSLVTPRWRWRPLMASLCVHAAGAGGLSLAGALLAPDPLDKYLTSSEHARLVPLRLESLVLPERLRRETPGGPVDLPAAPRDRGPDQAVLQPDASKAAGRTELPPMFYWARSAPPPPPERILKPSWKAPKAKPSLPEPPVLDVRNAEVRPAFLNIGARTMTQQPALPVDPGSRGMPVRDPAQANGMVSELGWDETGDPVNVFVLSSRAFPENGIVNVPRGSTVTSEMGGGGKRDGTPAVGPSGMPDVAPAAPDRGGITPQHGRGVAGSRQEGDFNPTEYATARYPANGSFDAITTHTSSADALPQATAKLSGAPVYTAYLAVGDGKDWIFQYCLKNSAAGPAHTGRRFITLAPERQVHAPFPRVTILPKATINPTSSYAIVHAILTAAGTLDDIRITGLLDRSLVDKLIRALAAWEFRPARLGAEAVDTEVLIGIPPAL